MPTLTIWTSVLPGHLQPCQRQQLNDLDQLNQKAPARETLVQIQIAYHAKPGATMNPLYPHSHWPHHQP